MEIAVSKISLRENLSFLTLIYCNFRCIKGIIQIWTNNMKVMKCMFNQKSGIRLNCAKLNFISIGYMRLTK